MVQWTGHVGIVTCIIGSPSGRFMFSSSSDSTIMVCSAFCHNILLFSLYCTKATKPNLHSFLCGLQNVRMCMEITWHTWATNGIVGHILLWFALTTSSAILEIRKNDILLYGFTSFGVVLGKGLKTKFFCCTYACVLILIASFVLNSHITVIAIATSVSYHKFVIHNYCTFDLCVPHVLWCFNVKKW